MSLIEQGLEPKALEPLLQAITLDPGFIQAHRDYMDLMQAQGFARDVLNEYRKRRDQAPSALTHYLYGRASGDISVAATEFELALKLDPKHHWSIQGLGGVAAAQGLLEAAIKHYQRALEIAPEEAEIYNKIANVQLARGEMGKAREAWGAAMRLAPNDYHAYLNLGAVLAMDGDLDGSAELLEQAVRRAPGNALAHVNYAYVLFKLQRFEESLAHFAAALAINPRDNTVQGSQELVAAVAEGRIPFAAFAPYEQALAAQVTEPSVAVQHYREVLLLAPNFAVAHLNLGLAQVAIGKPKEALASMERAVELAPGDSGARYNLGYLLLGMGRPKEGEQHLLEAHRDNPEDVESLVALAMAATAMGRTDESIHRYQQALKLQDRNPVIHVQFATAKAAADDLEGAEASIRMALAIAPSFVAARVQLVAILRENRKYDQALKELAILEKLAPEHPDLTSERISLESIRDTRLKEEAVPNRVRLSRIVVGDRELAFSLRQELAEGASFDALARQYGEGAERRHGGDIGFVNPDDLRGEVATAVTGLKPGAYSPVIPIDDRFLILKYTE